MTIRILAALILTVSIPLAAHAEEKALAEAGIQKIHNYYQNMVKRLSLSSGELQDIEMACMGEIFLEWFYVYKGIITRTDGLHYSEVNGFYEADQKALLVESDRKVYETIRNDVSAKILSEIDGRRQQSKWPAGPDALTLEQPKDQELLTNLEQCRDKEFVTAIRSSYDLAPGAENQQISIDIKPYQPPSKPGEKPSTIPPYYGEVTADGGTYSATYQNWLFDIMTR